LCTTKQADHYGLLIEKHNENVKNEDFICQDAKEIYDNLLKDNFKEKKSQKNVDNSLEFSKKIVFSGLCYGSFVISHLQKAMEKDLVEKGYADKDIQTIMGGIHHVGLSVIHEPSLNKGFHEIYYSNVNDVHFKNERINPNQSFLEESSVPPLGAIVKKTGRITRVTANPPDKFYAQLRRETPSYLNNISEEEARKYSSVGEVYDPCGHNSSLLSKIPTDEGNPPGDYRNVPISYHNVMGNIFAAKKAGRHPSVENLFASGEKGIPYLNQDGHETRKFPLPIQESPENNGQTKNPLVAAAIAVAASVLVVAGSMMLVQNPFSRSKSPQPAPDSSPSSHVMPSAETLSLLLQQHQR
jgi:hypothetical protein